MFQVAICDELAERNQCPTNPHERPMHIVRSHTLSNRGWRRWNVRRKCTASIWVQLNLLSASIRRTMVSKGSSCVCSKAPYYWKSLIKRNDISVTTGCIWCQRSCTIECHKCPVIRPVSCVWVSRVWIWRSVLCCVVVTLIRACAVSDPGNDVTICHNLSIAKSNVRTSNNFDVESDCI